MKIFKYIYFYIIILIKYSFNYIIYPFKTRKSIIKNTENNITLLFKSLQDNNIYINMEMGEPKQTIDVFLRSESDIIYFSEKNKTDLNFNYTNPPMLDVDSDLNNFFDKNKSTSLEMTNKVVEIWRNIGYYSSDKLYFKTDKENLVLRTSFALLKNTLGNMPGVLGISPIKYQSYRPYNLIEQLKSNDIINKYFWMIEYTSDYEGNLIIGEEPHIYDPKHYKEEDLTISYPFLYKTMQHWGLRFDDITFKNEYFRPFLECYFYYELNYIRGIDKFQKELDLYFNESIQNGTCFKHQKRYSYGPNEFYYCDKDKFKENVKYFPPLKFEHKDLNYTFELNYKDLFIEKDDKIILLIFFEGSGMDWYLGKPFLRKYSFLMNPDAKTVGFYSRIHNGSDEGNDNNDYENSSNNKDKLNNIFDNKTIFIIIGIAIIGTIILLILGIFIGKYIFYKKKKTLNVLEDDYDYIPQNANIINEG